jgi:C4-type Zn-finger protein
MTTHLRCPICFGEIADFSVEVYEDGYKKVVVIRGRCGKCGAPFKLEKVLWKEAYRPIPWRASVAW